MVIDTPANYSSVTREALDAADDVLVLSSLDVMSLKSARVGVETMQAMGVATPKMRFVLNRANTKVGLTERDAERAVQLGIDTALPSEAVVAESVNRANTGRHECAALEVRACHRRLGQEVDDFGAQRGYLRSERSRGV